MKAPKPIQHENAGVPDLTAFLDRNGVDVERIAGIKKRKLPITLFSLSSYSRAKDAIDFALHMRHEGAHVYVVGNENSGRMTSVLGYLNKYLKSLPPPDDTIYVHNFAKPHRPWPFFLPAGMACILKTVLSQLVKDINILIHKCLSQASYLKKVDTITGQLQAHIDNQMVTIQEKARKSGFEIVHNQDSYTIENLAGENVELTQDQMRHLNDIKLQISQLSVQIDLASQKIYHEVTKLKTTTVKKAIAPLMKPFREQFTKYLHQWVEELQEDILTHIDVFLEHNSPDSLNISPEIESRYSINIMIDHKGVKHPEVILEPRPTYENLFGSIKYKSTESGYETDFSLIRPGALHAANGGFLVLRAEDIAREFDGWEALKKALRDRRILIQERHRDHSLPIIDAPSPKSVNLDVQVFIIGSSYWYQNFFYQDPDFFSYFKIKADIESDMAISTENVKNFLKLIFQACREDLKFSIDKDAAIFLASQTTVWASSRYKMSSHFESVLDFLKEAKALCKMQKLKKITSAILQQVIEQRDLRNKRLEDHILEDIQKGRILIETTGAKVGQVNALTVMSYNDSHFGMPSRVTARTYASDKGLINIERKTRMAGPIQQKGAFIIEGFLNGLFAQEFPMSFGGSITFEQNYVDVDGDSASLAECVALLSSLSDVPVRQDIAMTGSINQFGQVQVIGGVNQKIEGFFRVCQNQGLTGTQGVIIPKENMDQLVLKDSIVQALKEKKFFLWGVSHIGEALALLTGDEHSFEDDGTAKLQGSSVIAKAYKKVAAIHK